MIFRSHPIRASLHLATVLVVAIGSLTACVADLDLGDHARGGDSSGEDPTTVGPPGPGPSGGSNPRNGDAGKTPEGPFGDGGTEADGGSNTVPGDAAVPPQDASLPPLVPNAKRVFETSGKFTGDLKTEGGGVDGVDGADKLCNTAAQAASLGGTWKAWISSSAVSAYDRIADVSPWYLVDRRTKVFDSKTGLVQGALRIGPLVDVDMNELGVKNDLFGNTWTGTQVRGAPAPKASGFVCNDWTSNRPINPYQGLTGFGISVDVSYWSDGSTSSCAGSNRLYCFEQ